MESTAGPAARRERFPAHHRVARRAESQVNADLRATLDARRELGPEYEGELVEGFLERLDQAIDARVDARLAQARAARPPARSGGIDGAQLALGIVTTTLAIPLTAITVVFDADFLTLVVWVGIIIVNLAGALSRRR